MHSLTVWTDPARYAREFGSTIALEAFEECFRRRAERQGGPIPAEVEQVFLQDAAPEFEAIRDMVTVHRLAQIRAADEEIAAQAARHADAVLRIATASTPAARHGRRQAELKIAAAQERRQRVLQGPAAWDAGLIFPNTFAPILVQGGDGLELRPMRYRCRPARLEGKLDGLLNGAHVARRDSLEGTWRDEFGISHGVVAAESFFASVAQHRLEQRALARGQGLGAVEFKFTPLPAQPLYLPCIWAHWERPGEPDLWSFAVVVDTAPVDLQAAGQDWGPVALKRENVAAWLNPDPADLKACYALLDERPGLRFRAAPSAPGHELDSRPARTRNKNLWKPTPTGG